MIKESEKIKSIYQRRICNRNKKNKRRNFKDEKKGGIMLEYKQ